MTEQAYLTKIRRYILKRESVRLKGNRCFKCGWSGNIAGFAFHHPDPAKKEFGLSDSITTNWEKYWKEAEKCELICHTCHMILHSKNNDEKFLQDVENYDGRDLISSNIPWKNQTHIPILYELECKYCKCKFQKRSNYKRQIYCSNKCKASANRKCVRPSLEDLRNIIGTIPMTHIAKKYGVSSNAIKKWCKSYNIKYK